MVFAGRDGFWKYEVAKPGLPGPARPSIDALGERLLEDWVKLRTCAVGYASVGGMLFRASAAVADSTRPEHR